MPNQLWQYQQKADPPQQEAAPVVPEQPWLLEVLPLPKPRLRVEGLAGPPVIALPFDLPLLDASPLVMRRIEPRREGYTSPIAPLPYDLPLLGEAPAVVRRVARAQGDGSTEYGRADAVPAVPDLVALNLVSPLPRPRRSLDSGGGTVPILSAQPFPGDLATTIVAGSLPCAIIPSGMTPGDDADG